MSTASVPRVRRGVIAAVSLASLIAGSFTLTALSAQAADDLPSTFLDTASTWSYSDTNTDPAAGDSNRLVWTLAGYDASAWKTGVGPFGAKNGSSTPDLGTSFPVTTVLQHYVDPTATSKTAIPSYHFRNSFELSAAQLDGITSITGTVVYDDAVQIFVNGSKVAGFADARVEEVADELKNLSYAGNSAGDPVTSTFSIPASALTEGTNTVAISLHQDRASSSDIYLNLVSLVPVEKDAVSTTLTDIVLGVGADETQRNLSWYSASDTEQVAQYAPASAVVNGVFPASAVTVAASGVITTSSEYSRKATLADLAENTAYVYRVGNDGNWSAVSTFRTQSFDGDFEFLFFGDPQIGASGNVANDQAGWTDTLDIAQSSFPDAELLFSAGDQVETAGNETQYEAFLAPEQLREIPLVATNGNHDVGSKAYEQHYNLPNYDASSGAASSATASGGDYWFIYKDVLFVNINSNSRDYASHNAFMEQVVAEQGWRAKWKVLAFHHSIYSVASHASDSSIVDRRNNMPATISTLGFDLVLQGHDHNYTRSYLVKDGALANASEVAGQSEVVANEGEVLYLTANSASGSKYYSTTTPNAWYASVINQEQVRNYSSIEVTDEAITISTIRSESAGDDKPVNSVVDTVTLRQAVDPNAQEVEVTVPEQATGEFVWSIEGGNELVDLGTAVDNGDHYLASGAINPIRVTDTRSSRAGWSVSGQLSDFVAGDTRFSGKYFGWTPSVVEEGGDAVAGDAVASGFDSGDGLSVSSILGQAPSAHVRGSAKLSAILALKLPIDVAEGTYSGTLTLTALN